MACFNLLILQSNLDDVICRLGKGVLRWHLQALHWAYQFIAVQK